eukprot:TRINITY_DN4590_c0_g1_i14.p1 TRINITY_DN4590_c0_g1~~TRINITY_DN4590_c0_g1_i14.p1  ORF type:complete len:190 (+),score=38.11 TRINITY_DN4590_c0_g1_i14:140-709(+)
MLRSLVGSEMCIRDSPHPNGSSAQRPNSLLPDRVRPAMVLVKALNSSNTALKQHLDDLKRSFAALQSRAGDQGVEWAKQRETSLSRLEGRLEAQRKMASKLMAHMNSTYSSSRSGSPNKSIPVAGIRLRQNSGAASRQNSGAATPRHSGTRGSTRPSQLSNTGRRTVPTPTRIVGDNITPFTDTPAPGR